MKNKTDTLARAEWEKEHDTYIAYCSCGDALERTGLYPNEAKYSCFGCDKTYELVEVGEKDSEVWVETKPEEDAIV